ncbi:MAG TPA: Omp28-related outer membrane protein [Saprospiraceae bacterium]|nr:Omp28-related outer membrane protein [Saprospiraceae bacterium]HND88981.1 Omp28-related outer membrane protein [Saprospiraceae bacterium]
MLKNVLLPAVALLFALSLSAQGTHTRRVLVEEFTQASCGPCASQNPAFNEKLRDNKDIVSPIKYQTSWPGVDPMNAQNASEVATRVSYYGVSGVPNAFLNGVGVTNDCNAYPNAPACMSVAELMDASNKLTPVTMTIKHQVSADHDTVYVQVTVKSDDALSGTLRLRVAVTEDEINFSTPPGSNGELDFYQVMRKMLPDPAGTATNAFTAGETKTYSFAWALKNFYDINKINAVAWLQDDATKQVYQSERTEPVSQFLPLGVDIAKKFSFVCVAGTNGKFTMTNTANDTLTSAKLRFRVGTGAWKFYDWVGSLLPGKSEEVVITDVVYNTAGTTKLDVEPLESNNGIQTNLIGAITSISTRVLSGQANLLPLKHDFQSGAFVPSTWTLVNDGTNGWKLNSAGGAGGSTRSGLCNFYNISGGKEVAMTTNKIDLSQVNGDTKMDFDYAYAYYDDTYFDSLRIEISSDCGETWKTVFLDGKDGLATAPPFADPNVAWAPTAADWKAASSINLSELNGKSEALVRFVGLSGFGNNFYIDNINITTTTSVNTVPGLTAANIAPNPTASSSELRFSLEQPQSLSMMVYDMEGSLVQSLHLGNLPSGDHVAPLDATQLPSGSYRLVLQGKTGLTQMQWIVVK